MKKKTKKIPKFANGGTWDKVSTGIEAGVGILGQTFGKPATFGGVVSGMGQGAAAGASIGGPMGAFIGGAAGGLLAGIGTGASVDDTGYNMQRASGLSKLFGIGKSNSEMYAEAYRKQNSTQNKRLTQQMQYEFMADPRNTLNTNVFANAAEGGVMRQPVNALVSPGEIVIDPYTLEYELFGTGSEEPNSKDNIPVVLEEGEIVKSHAKHMKMPNGKTPADNSKMVLDSNMPEEMKRKMIKKIDNWESAHRTKPQQYAKFDEGNSGFFNYLVSNRTRPIDAVISEYMKQYGKTAKEFEGFDGSDLSFLQGLQNIITANDKYVLPIRFKGGKSFDQVRSMPISSAVEFNPEYWNYYYQLYKPNNTLNTNVVKPTKPLWQPTENIGITTHPEIDNVWSRHKTSDFVALETTIPKKDEVSKPSSGKKTTTSRVTTSTTPQEEKPTPEQIAESLRIEDIGERHWLRGPVTEPKQSFASLAQISPEKIKLQGVNKTAPLNGIKPLYQSNGDDTTAISNGSDWRDGLYRMAVLSRPLWDRAKAEPVNYESPVYKYMPAAIDVATQLADIDQSYALARYNFANLYPNSGAGMAAGLQAATDRSKQRAAIRQYQTNAQNNLIGKNAGIYNNWSNEHARIMNDVYDKYAANRASARNINRQNTAEMLNNFGQMLRDDKQFAMDTMKLRMMEPMIQYGYENYNDYLNWKKANGYG